MHSVYNVNEKHENTVTVNLRAHHLMCSVLYVGKGYSDDFTDNMTKTVEKLRNGCRTVLQTTPDEICVECPNKLADGSCRLDDDLNRESHEIASLDELVLRRFGFVAGEDYDSAELFRHISAEITEDDFNYWCSECRWKKQGLCSYEKYIKRVMEFYQ